jgi:hypothetical protein
MHADFRVGTRFRLEKLLPDKRQNAKVDRVALRRILPGS